MIISHEHRYIFLKTAKTAGSSIEHALRGTLGPEDIVGGVKKAPWRAKGRSAKGRNSFRGLGRLGIHIPGSLARYAPQISGFYAHMPGSQVRALVGDEIWNSYYKFSIERNPWDRQVSLFFYRHKRRKRSKNLTFESYLTSPWYTTFHSVRLNNWETYSFGDEIAVDRVLRMENIEQEFAEVCDHLGLTDVSLPRINVGPKREQTHYRDYYNAETKSVIERWYQREIDAFGYEF